MSRSQHTFAKRQRELAKKKKADEKRAKRLNKGVDPEASADIEESADSAVSEEVQSDTPRAPETGDGTPG